MLSSIQNLDPEEKELLMDALPMVTVLIAAADGKIDSRETDWAAKLTDMRSYSHEKVLQDYYEEVSKTFEQKVRMMIKELQSNQEEIVPLVSQQLAGLNEILPKLPPEIATKFIKSLTTFASHIARASGGFLRMASISKEEQALVDLPMITYKPHVEKGK